MATPGKEGSPIKIDYEPETSQSGPAFQLYPSEKSRSTEEMRFLTILADLCERPDIRIRVSGTKRSHKSIPGQPANPVQRLRIVIEKLDGSPPRAKELLQAERDAVLDPNKPVTRHQASQQTAMQNARNRNMRITDDGEHFVIEEP